MSSKKCNHSEGSPQHLCFGGIDSSLGDCSCYVFSSHGPIAFHSLSVLVVQTVVNGCSAVEIFLFEKCPLKLLRIIYYFVKVVERKLFIHPIFSTMNIFVARLNFKTRREDLEAAFAKFGQVTSAKIVKDRDTGRSKGFGFVEMANDAEAQAAIAALNETELDGRTIVVKPANPKGEGGGQQA